MTSALPRLRAREGRGIASLAVTRASAQIFVEPVEGALPGELGGRFVVARRGVVVKAVLRAGIDVAFMRHMTGGERLVERRPSRRDAFVLLAVLRQQRRLDLA